MAAVIAAAVVVMAMALAAAALPLLGLVVHSPSFFASWFGVAAGVAVLVWRRAHARASVYRLGAGIDADAFAMAELELVRRVGADYEIGLVPGMSGTWNVGRTPMPVEGLTGKGVAHFPLPRDGRVRIEFGRTTFVLARVREAGALVNGRWSERLRGLGAGGVKKLAQTALAGLPLAVLGTLACAMPAAAAVTEADMRSIVSLLATPWETELSIRAQAQKQSNRLHECFDPLPLACQRPGYVGVGLRLSPKGEVLDHWIARSTYGQDCPVTSCMGSVVAGWFFEPIRETMKVVVPVQVRRNDRLMDSMDSIVGAVGAPGVEDARGSEASEVAGR